MVDLSMASVRQMTAADAAALKSVRLASLEDSPEAYSSTFDQEQAYSDELWTERAAGSSSAAMFVAHDDVGGPVGMVGAYQPGQAGLVELVSMWTAPSARGAGVGRALVSALLDWSCSAGAFEVQLWVMRGNDPAVGLYKRCGFVELADYDAAASDPCANEIRMSFRF